MRALVVSSVFIENVNLIGLPDDPTKAIIIYDEDMYVDPSCPYINKLNDHLEDSKSMIMSKKSLFELSAKIEMVLDTLRSQGYLHLTKPMDDGYCWVHLEKNENFEECYAQMT